MTAPLTPQQAIDQLERLNRNQAYWLGQIKRQLLDCGMQEAFYIVVGAMKYGAPGLEEPIECYCKVEAD